LREFPDHADLFSIGALQLGRQYIPNHNGLLGRYPGADGMKTGFTCPAGFNVVASANHSGRRLIVVVLGAPTPRTRNQEAADLFDRGFAMGGGAGSLESMPSGSGAPDPHSNVCLHRNAVALAAAAEDDDIQAQAAAGSGLPTPLAALFAPVAHTVLPDGRIRFDPVPVYIGPAPGWKGPVLGARPTATETPVAPGGAKTISPENASTVATTSEGDASAPVQSSSRSKLKLARRPGKRMAHKPVNSIVPSGAKTVPAENASTVATTSEGDASAPVQSSSGSKLKLARHPEKRMARKPIKSAPEKLEKKDVSTD
jgi:D-alanyl-D-alanine carboxypeptidase